MTGQRSPIDPTVRFADDIKSMRADIAELQRLLGTSRHIQAGVTEITTDGSGQATITFPASFSSTSYAVSLTPATSVANFATLISRAVGSMVIELHSDAGTVGSGVVRNIHWTCTQY